MNKKLLSYILMTPWFILAATIIIYCLVRIAQSSISEFLVIVGVFIILIMLFVGIDLYWKESK